MKELSKKTRLLLFIIFLFALKGANASKLKSFKVVDNQYLMLLFYDGEVKFIDDGKGKGAYTNYGGTSESNNYVENYGSPLDLDKAVLTGSYTIKSKDDAYFGSSGQNPEACHRKSKVNGMAEMGWIENVPYNDFGDYEYQYTYKHWIFVKLPKPMQRGKNYTLEIDGATNADKETITFTFDEFHCPSEAVHVNLVGYADTETIKAADVYLWMGDGGARDYSAYENNKVYVYNIETKDTVEVGKLTFWQTSSIESGFYDYIKAKVWNADFTGFSTPGKYRLVVEDIGCSEDFEIAEDVHYNPFAVMVQGFYYMRAGEDSTNNPATLVPRRPLWIPGENPKNCKVLITSMHPYHDNWHSFASGDKWDKPDKWGSYVKEGSPENPNAIGGHVDALDWDRHLGHVSIIYDMLLPFLLTNGAIDDDNIGIAESGNQIPDLLDEARNEVDFWLRLRDGLGYSHGLTNPDNQNVIYQAGTNRVAAYVNAANSAMLAECFRINGNEDLMIQYRDSAIVAYNYANNLTSESMDTKLGIGEDMMPASDFKMMAAAYLYNLTGDTKYEDVIKNLSKVSSATSQVNKRDHWNQLYATVAYLLTNREVHYSGLFINMKKSLIYQAHEMEAKWCNLRATRRANANNHGYYPTIQNVQRTIVAHAIANNAKEKQQFIDALTLEADWSLGRNPANMIQMTTATTELAEKRSVQNIYTNGRNDGVPGLNPGHTPYFNTEDWACSMMMGCPGNLVKRNYPENKNLWPKAELFYNTRYVWAHAEFTPQQTMRGKMALYGYLYGLEKMEMTDMNIPAKGIWLDQDTIRFFPENNIKIDVTVIPANASEKEVVWSTQDKSIAAIDDNGKITAGISDTTKIFVSASDGELADTCIVIVKPIEVPVTGVNIKKDTLQLRVGKSMKLDAMVMPENASDKSIIWYVQKSDIAEVDDEGQVKAKNEGATYIFAETINENKKDSCYIEIFMLPELICHLDFEKLMDNTFEDQTGNQHNGTANGNIKLVPGRIEQAIAFDGENDYIEIAHSDDFQWNMENSYSISVWIFVDELKNNWTGVVTKSRDISPWSGLWISPENKWHSANSIFESADVITEKRWYHVVIVQDTETAQHRLYIDGELKETSSLVAQTDKGDIWIGGAKTTNEFFKGKIDELRIYTVALSDDKVKYFYNQGLSKNAEVTGIQLEPQKDTIELNVGDIYQLSAVIEPENAIDQTIMWKSDNISVASVDQNGKISAIAEGSAKITVSSNSDNAETSCFVYVSSENSGFKQYNDYSKIILYPNPVRKKIYLGLNEHSGITNYTIYNFTGRDLKRGTIMHHSRTIDVENLPNGLYFIEFQCEKTKNCIKFIIQN